MIIDYQKLWDSMEKDRKQISQEGRAWKYQNTNAFKIEVEEILKELTKPFSPKKKYPAEMTEIQYEGNLIDR